MNPNLPYPFDIFAFSAWVQRNNPSLIVMKDREYALLSMLLGKCPQDFQGIRIAFSDAPQIP